jgi:hypothetical protein
MGIKYIIDNLDGSLTEQVIYGGLSADTFSATTLYVDGSQITKPYKVYTALLTQTGTSAPVATVLENTLGEEIIWVRNDVGDYQADCSLLVDTEGYADNKAFSNIFGYNTIQGSDSPTNTTAKYSEQWFETGVIKLTTVTLQRDGSTNNPTFEDGLLYLIPIEIRVYN